MNSNNSGVILIIAVIAGMFFGILNSTNLIDSISDAITRKQMEKLLADPSEFTVKRAIRIATFIKDEESCYPRAPLYQIQARITGINHQLISNPKDPFFSSAQDAIDACEETREQFKEACSLMIKVCSPPLQDKLDEACLRALASLLLRLINLQNSAVTLYNTVFSPLIGLENTKAARETAENCFPNLFALHDECSNILSGLNSVLEVATKAVCAPISVTKPAAKHAKTAFDQVRDAARRCKSVSVRAKMDQLIDQLTVYLESAPEGTDLTNRINSYYLPTLSLVLQDLSTAEKKKSKMIQVREDLCLKTIETVSNILNTHQESEDSADLINITAEVDAMHSMAALKGDLPSTSEFKPLSR